MHISNTFVIPNLTELYTDTTTDRALTLHSKTLDMNIDLSKNVKIIVILGFKAILTDPTT